MLLTGHNGEKRMPSIKIRLGNLEVEYDGDQKFIESGLLSLISDLKGAAPPATGGAANGLADKATPNGALGHTTSQIAQIMSVSTGPDLAIAAAAHLTLVKGQTHLQRAEILKEMKGAPSFYTDGYSGNLTSILNGLVKKKTFNPIGANVFALANGPKKEIEEKLANE
jgi:hypothetical protein